MGIKTLEGLEVAELILHQFLHDKHTFNEGLTVREFLQHKVVVDKDVWEKVLAKLKSESIDLGFIDNNRNYWLEDEDTSRNNPEV